MKEQRSKVAAGVSPVTLGHPRERGAARREGPAEPAVLVIGASTGGPQALVSLLTGLTTVLPLVPVCVTLHMPRDLLPMLATSVARQCRISALVVNAPVQLRNGIVHFAPGDSHLDFRRTANGIEAVLVPAAAPFQCKPAVDAMFSGAARIFGARTLGVVLSGMGQDGLAGAHAITAAGGAILVQDEATSPVWGMPGAVAKAGLADASLPPDAIALEIVRRLHPLGTMRS